MFRTQGGTGIREAEIEASEQVPTWLLQGQAEIRTSSKEPVDGTVAWAGDASDTTSASPRAPQVGGQGQIKSESLRIHIHQETWYKPHPRP